MVEALTAGGVITLLSLTGALFLGNRSRAGEMHHIVLPVAVGVFLGIVFFELLPETFEASPEWGPVAVLVGFLGFYCISHFLETFHHHHADDHDACMGQGARMLLIGDAVHNLADGVVIASAFMIDPTVGVLTTIGIALHEIPQEIAEFGVLIRAGYTRTKVLVCNFLSASSVFFGILLTYFFSTSLESSLFILTGIAGGNLLYIATADLIPELRHSHRDHFAKTFLLTLFGASAIAILVTITHAQLP